MKKGSTAAAKQSSNFSQEKLTIGLDLGDRSSYWWKAPTAENDRACALGYCHKLQLALANSGFVEASGNLRTGTLLLAAAWRRLPPSLAGRSTLDGGGHGPDHLRGSAPTSGQFLHQQRVVEKSKLIPLP